MNVDYSNWEVTNWIILACAVLIVFIICSQIYEVIKERKRINKIKKDMANRKKDGYHFKR